MDTRRIKNRRFPKEFRLVTKYIKENKGIDVVLGEDTDYKGPFTREIIIHHNYDLRNNGLFVLLFECGKSMIPYSNPNKFNKETEPLEYNHYQWSQDCDAWSKALNIVKTLNLEVSLSEFFKFRDNHLLKYFSDKVW